MIITLDNLTKGIDWWQKESKWPTDFLNSDYYCIYDDRARGVTDEWWRQTLDRLSKWRAFRGPKPPNSKDAIDRCVKKILDQVSIEYDRLSKEGEPSIADLQWEDIGTLFEIVSGVKPRSFVFASKMCHFLFPKLFIVVDNLATSVFDDYEFYWRGMKDEWNRFEGKNEARKRLVRAMNLKKPLHPHYPLETKIMELSHIGRKHG
jgi:hypothetical protein